MREGVIFETLGYEEGVTCIGCEKKDKTCLVIRTAEYTGPHCARCLLREGRKRKRNEKQEAGLFDREGEKK